MMTAFAELERDIIHERTMAGLAAARAQGRNGGRPTVMDADKLAAAKARRERGEACGRCGCDGQIAVICRSAWLGGVPARYLSGGSRARCTHRRGAGDTGPRAALSRRRPG